MMKITLCCIIGADILGQLTEILEKFSKECIYAINKCFTRNISLSLTLSPTNLLLRKVFLICSSFLYA